MADKFAIITGASTGIGFELATLAAQDGYDILVVADEALINDAARDFKQFGTQVQAVEADLSTIEGVDKLLAAVRRRDLRRGSPRDDRARRFAPEGRLTGVDT